VIASVEGMSALDWHWRNIVRHRGIFPRSPVTLFASTALCPTRGALHSGWGTYMVGGQEQERGLVQPRSGNAAVLAAGMLQDAQNATS